MQSEAWPGKPADGRSLDFGASVAVDAAGVSVRHNDSSQQSLVLKSAIVERPEKSAFPMAIHSLR